MKQEFRKVGIAYLFARNWRKTAIFAGIPLLAACGQPKPIILTPPTELLACAPAPAVPETLPPQGTKERDDATLAVWLAERAAGADCRAKVDGVRAWVETAND